LHGRGGGVEEASQFHRREQRQFGAEAVGGCRCVYEGCSLC
jgi:hypothetical protein